MKRREFITLRGGAAAWPLAARGHPGVPMALNRSMLTAMVFPITVKERGRLEGTDEKGGAS